MGEVKCYFDYSSSHEDTDFLADVYSNFKANNGREPDAKEMSWMNFTKHTVVPLLCCCHTPIHTPLLPPPSVLSQRLLSPGLEL